MNKAQLHSALLRKRSRCFYAAVTEHSLASVRTLHHSSANAVHTSSHRPSERSPSSQRLQDTASEIKRVFDHGSRFHDISQRKGGEPVEQRESQAKVRYTAQERTSPTNASQSRRAPPSQGGAVDARSFAAQSKSTSRRFESEGQRVLPESAVDARGLAAQDASQIERRSPAPGDVIDARDLAAQNLHTSDVSTEDRPRPLIRRVLEFEDSTRPIIPRSTNRNLDRPPRRDPRPRSGVDAASRKPPSGPGPRKKPQQGGASRDAPSYGEDTNAGADDIGFEAWEYLQQLKAKKTEPKAVEYQPAEMTLDSLRGNGPSMELGDWGKNEAVEEWVHHITKHGEKKREQVALMAEKWKNGQYVNYRDWETKKRILDAVEYGIRDLSEEEQAAVAEKLRDTFRTELADRVFKGQYMFEGRKGASVLDSVARQAAKNGSFLPRHGESFAAKVRMLLPVEDAGGSQKRVRA